MSLKRECDRCHHIALAESLNAQEMRVVHVERGATASSMGGATIITTNYDLCKQCLIDLTEWLTPK